MWESYGVEHNVTSLMQTSDMYQASDGGAEIDAKHGYGPVVTTQYLKEVWAEKGRRLRCIKMPTAAFITANQRSKNA